MDIKLPHSLLTQYLDTDATPKYIAEKLSLCGPTVDRLHKLEKDTVYDIEIITNRVDSASAFGVAREAATILKEFKFHSKLVNDPYRLTKKDLRDLPTNQPVDVQIMDSTLVPRFACIALSNPDIKDSPQQTQSWLNAADQRPLNNVIDITNELALRYGQPVHVFDLDKIKGSKMIVRESKKGEKITTLDGKTHTLKGGDIVIEDGEGRLIDLCGIMGGGLSDVDENTKNILLFVQTYEPKRIRRTSLYTQERTLASQLFEKGIDPELVLPVLIRGVQLLQERTGAIINSHLIDIYPQPPQTKKVSLNTDWLREFSGTNISDQKITSILSSLGFTTANKVPNLAVTVPSWRINDINLPEDLAEEVMRVYGYFKLESILPPTVLTDTTTESVLTDEIDAKHHLVGLGFTEIFNNSLVSAASFSHIGESSERALKLKNPLSTDLEYLRTSLLPSLLQNLSDNRGLKQKQLAIFELANVYLPKDKKLPLEQASLALVTKGHSYAEVKGYLETLLNKLHLDVTFTPAENAPSLFTPAQTAAVFSSNKLIGHIGLVNPEVSDNFSLTGEIVAVSLNFDLVSTLRQHLHHFKPVPTTASVIEDITINSTKPVAELLEKLKSAHPYIYSVSYKNSHQNNHTFTIEFNNPKKNLTQTEVNSIKSKIIKGSE